MTKELPRIDPSKYTVTEKGNVIKPEKVIEIPIKGKVNVALSKKNKRGFEITKEELEKENAELKDKLNNLSSVVAVRLANWQKCAKDIEVLTKDKDYFSDALDKQIEATLKLLQEFYKAKEIICEYVRLANLEKEDTVAIWQLYHKAEDFLKESE